MTDLELHVRRILSVYRQRHRVVSLPAADDEAAAAIVAAAASYATKVLRECGEPLEAPARKAVGEPERVSAPAVNGGKGAAPARRTTRPRVTKRPA